MLLQLFSDNSIRDAGRRLIIVPLKGWKISHMWEQIEQTKFLFRKKLRADRS